MTTTAERTVRELALENSNATRVFERLGIDYCCGGSKSLREACSAANLDIEQVSNSLRAADHRAEAATSDRDWLNTSLAELIEHIQNTHHVFTRDEIARLTALLDKVCSVHGQRHPELLEIQESFSNLSHELTLHMLKEERILFPYVLGMESAFTHRNRLPVAPFGRVQNPVAMMEHEHDSAGNALCAMREASHGYTVPVDACVSYQTLYSALASFEADLHQHIHLENNILFPRAIAMEAAGQ